jgi:hypothetical protein
MALRCDRCFSKSKPLAPMFQDATWLKLAKRHETLCAKCAFARAHKRGINLTFDDLLPCVSNLAGPWFDQFFAAEPSEKILPPERAYAWQRAILLRATQMRGSPPVAKGKVLAADQNGLTLREAPEGGLYGWDEIDWANGEKYFKVDQPDGEPTEILIHFERDNSMRLKEIIAPLGPGTLGTGKMRSIFRLLQRAYPGIETLGGYRMTGVRMSRPVEVKFNLRRLAGTASATREAA